MPLNHARAVGAGLATAALLAGAAAVVRADVARTDGSDAAAGRPAPPATPPATPSATPPATPPATPSAATTPGVEGPPLQAARVLVHGARLTCPKGAEPGVRIQAATFEPSLDGGTRFLAGTYRIRLTGSVVNETTSAITVRSVQLSVRGRHWRAAVRAPHALGANASAPFAVSGTWVVRHAGSARIDARLHWAWTQSSLEPCGGRGLVEDD